MTRPNRGVKLVPGVTGRLVPLMVDGLLGLSAAANRVSSIKVSRANDLLAWIQRGELSVRVGGEFGLDKAADAHAALAGRKTTGKVLLIP